MEEGSKARVDNFVQVIYGRESEVRLLLLLAIWCGRGLCDHRYASVFVRVSNWSPSTAKCKSHTTRQNVTRQNSNNLLTFCLRQNSPALAVRPGEYGKPSRQGEDVFRMGTD